MNKQIKKLIENLLGDFDDLESIEFDNNAFEIIFEWTETIFKFEVNEKYETISVIDDNDSIYMKIVDFVDTINDEWIEYLENL